MSVAVRALCSNVGQNEDGKIATHIDRARGLSLKGRTAQIINGRLVMVEGPKEDDSRDLSADGDSVQIEAIPIASTSRVSMPSPKATSTASRPKLSRRQTRYFCTWEGCMKSYAKPVRLEEHLRSHTGERPYECSHEGCGASYLRDTHLVAHMRTHLDEKDKPFTCMVEGCEKKFWTNQHLNRHIKLVHEQNNGAYKCDQCGDAFNKHNKLREHIVKKHMPEGTKPFFCEAEGCGKSFATSSTLRTHSKLHDENRYVCMHPSHLSPQGDGSSAQESRTAATGDVGGNSFPHFSTWSALQEHNKTDHPPTCLHPECHGRTFRSNKKLRKHCIKVHLETFPGSSEKTLTAVENESLARRSTDVSVVTEEAPFPVPEHTPADLRKDDGITVQHPSSGANAAALHNGNVTDEGDAATTHTTQESVEACGVSTRVLAGRSRKRQPTRSTDNDQLIPTQPVAVYQDFDGIDDYDHRSTYEDNQEGAPLANKRVRFA